MTEKDHDVSRDLLGAPPRVIDRAARREDSAIVSATGSTPSTSRSGFAAALVSTNRPSPVPRSTVTPSQPAARAVSYPTSTSWSRRPITVRMGGG